MPVTGQDVVTAFRAACAAHGAPAATLTDNGLVFTTRLLPSGPSNALEQELASRGVTRKNGKPSHPQTQGKVERLQCATRRVVVSPA
jgi:transposase InsO family protein